MKDVVVYKCLFVWEAQLCFLQAPSAALSHTLTAAAEHSLLLLFQLLFQSLRRCKTKFSLEEVLF